jgi:hypothetical protein
MFCGHGPPVLIVPLGARTLLDELREKGSKPGLFKRLFRRMGRLFCVGR